MHPDLLLKALTAIVPETTLEIFQTSSGISSRAVAKDVINFLASNNIGVIGKSAIRFSGSDRIYSAMLALQSGCDIEHVSGCLSWRDFEKLASQVLGSFGYKTKTNVHLSKPRMEIDVVGVSSGFAIAVDCKHWSRSSISSIGSFAEKQAARARRLIECDGTIFQAVPVIMTLHAESIRFAGGVPIVPVHKFRSFVIDVRGFWSDTYAAG